MYGKDGKLLGVQAVIDKDLAAALLAEQLEADLLVIATDVDGVCHRLGHPQQARLGNVTVDQVVEMNLPAGSMGPRSPRVRLRHADQNEAVIGSLADIDRGSSREPRTRVRAGEHQQHPGIAQDVGLDVAQVQEPATPMS